MRCIGLGEFIDTVVVWAQFVVSTMGYPGLVMVMFLENIFPPIPSEVILLSSYLTPGAPGWPSACCCTSRWYNIALELLPINEGVC